MASAPPQNISLRDDLGVGASGDPAVLRSEDAGCGVVLWKDLRGGVLQVASAASAHFVPFASVPSARSTDGEPGPASTSAAAAAISTRLYS